MITSTFELNGIKTSVASRTRRTEILEAKYRTIIATRYPVITPYVIELASVPKPAIPSGIDVTKLRGEVLDRYTQLQMEYEAKVEVVRAKHPEGYPLYIDSLNLSYLLSRINEIVGATFKLSDTKPVRTFTEEDVMTAFELWLDGGSGEDDWWKMLISEIKKVDVPLTPPTEAPPGSLSEDQSKDPLSEKVESTSS